MHSSITFWQRIRRTPYQAIASVFMVTVTLFTLAVFLLLAATLSSLLSYFEAKPQITVFFKDNKDKIQIDTIVDKLKSTGKVASYEYISKEQALAVYKEKFKSDPLLLELVTADILPSSLEISATSPNYLGELAEVVKKEPGVDEVLFPQDIVDTLVSWTAGIRQVGTVYIVLLIFTSFFIIITSIGIKIAFRKDEIEILKLIGATPWYIKKPFLLEGGLYGAVGAMVSWALVSFLILYMQPFMSSFLRGLPPLAFMKISRIAVILWPPTLPLYGVLWLLLTVTGIVIGFLGSLFAVNRFVKY